MQNLYLCLDGGLPKMKFIQIFFFDFSAKKLKDEFIHNGNRNKHNININLIIGDEDDVIVDHNNDIIVFLILLFAEL